MNKNNITEKQYQAELLECVRRFTELEKNLQCLEGQIRVLEAENDFLSMKNAEYERKLSLITNNPILKAGIKLYQVYSKMRHKR